MPNTPTENADTLDGTGNNDVIDGLGGNDTIHGAAGNDSLTGGTGDDQLFGDDSFDTLTGGAGSDTVDGGDGTDVASYNFSSLGSALDLDLSGLDSRVQATFADPLGGTDTLKSIEQIAIAGTAYNDHITGSPYTVDEGGIDFGNMLNGLGGDDTLTGAGGADLLIGGTGNDTLNGMAGDDDIVGGPGDDVIDGGAGHDHAVYDFSARGSALSLNLTSLNPLGETTFADGLGGTDTLKNVDAMLIVGSAFDDTITGSTFTVSDPAHLFRVDGNGFAGPVGFANNLLGGAGNDTLTGQGDMDWLQGDAGNDTLIGNSGNDELRGDDGNDQLYAGAGDDKLYGGAGYDILLSGPGGSDLVDGGDGTDFVIYNASSLGSAVTLDFTNIDPLNGTVSDPLGGTDTLTNVEQFYIVGTAFDDHLIGSNFSIESGGIGYANFLVGGSGNDVLDGAGQGDQLQGDDGNDTLNGGGGGDWLKGGAGNDLLDGGTGHDQVVFDFFALGSAITFDATTLNPLVDTTFGDGQGGTDTIKNIEGVTLVGSAYNDTLTGSAFAVSDPDHLFGQSDSGISVPAGFANVMGGAGGNDTLIGAGDMDWLRGDEGDDTVRGMGGADELHGNDGNDTLIGGFDNGYNPQPGDGADTLYGEAGNDTLTGADGDDSLHGGAGNDSLRGDAGSDLLDGGDGIDLAVYSYGGQSSGLTLDLTSFDATIQATLTDVFGGTDTLKSIEQISIGGTSYDDVLTGSTFTVSNGNVYANFLYGGDGNDQINGQGDKDGLFGAGGNDTLNGKGGDDFLSGGDGDDSLIGGGGNNTLDGGNGSDLALYGYAWMSGGVTLDLSTVNTLTGGSFARPDGGTDTLTSVEKMYLAGTPFADHLTASAFTTSGGLFDFANNIHGNGGDDTITGAGDADLLYGGEGNDTLNGGGGNDQLVGEAGDDTLDGGAGYDRADYIFTGRTSGINFGVDGYNPATGGTLTDGTGGTDTLTSIEAFTIIGSSYDDVLAGSTLAISNPSGLFLANASGQLIEAGFANDLYGGDGNDTLTGGNSSDWLQGDAGDDWIIAGAGDDRVMGGAGKDLLRGDAGSDLLDGGDGVDLAVYVFSSLNHNVIFDLYSLNPVTGATLDDPLGGTDTLNGVEQIYVEGTAFNDLILASRFTVSAGGAHFANMLIGGDGNDHIGGAGDRDLLQGDAGKDYLTGEGGADEIWGGSGDDTIYGDGFYASSRDGDDILYGEAGDDQLRGGAGNDILVGGAGNDLIAGGDGKDEAIFYLPVGTLGTYSIIDAPGVPGRKLVLLTNGGPAETVAFIEKITGGIQVIGYGKGASIGDDDQVLDVERLTFATDSGSNTPLAKVSLDVATGRVSDGLLQGATVFMDANGNGQFDAGEVQAVTGDDGGFSFLFAGSGPMVVIGGVNADTGLPNQVTLAAPEGSTVINPLTTLIEAVLEGGSVTTAEDAAGVVADALGLSGSLDLLNTELVTAADGGDADALAAQKAAVALVSLMATANNAGGEGTDMEALASLAAIIAAAPADPVLLSDLGLITHVLEDHLAPGALDAAVASIVSTVQAIEQAGSLDDLTAAQAAALTTGNELDNVLTGGANADTLIGLGGNDTLDGGAGADLLFGGTGDDSYVVDQQGDLVFEDVGGGTDLVTSTAGFYLYANIEKLTLASGAGDIYGVGNELDNVMTGNEGINLMIGWDGNDEIHGGAGNDVLFGVNGADHVYGEVGLDYIAAGDGDDVIDGGADVDALYGEGGNDTLLGGAGIDYLVAGDGDDTLDGGADSDALYGQDGNDTLSGGSDFKTDILVGGDGSDVLHADSGLNDFDLIDGGAGDDIYWVDTGDDQTFEAVNGGNDTVHADVSNVPNAGVYLWANVENLILEGTTAFGVGNVLDNHLTGSASKNWLLGGAGDDIIDGKGGDDVLFGEAGADIFVLAAGTGGDTICDFQAGVDKIDLSSFHFSWADVQSRMTDHLHVDPEHPGSDMAINLSNGDFIVINSVTMASLHEADFVL